MTMMATQEATDPSVLLNHNASKDTVAVDDDRSDEIVSPPPINDVKASRRSENGSSTTTMMSMTPPRSSLASDPNLTPIASIKRPRANLPRTNSASNRTSAMLMSPTTPNDAAITRRAASTPLSPMHKIKPVLHREDHSPTGGEVPIKDKVDELFSPVVQFLHEDHHSSQENEHTEEGSEAEDDVSMTRPEQHDGADGEFNPWQFIASLPPYDTVKGQRPPITLPPQAPDDTRKTLVLDLDETLVHCSVVEPTDRVADFTFPVQFHGETYTVHVKCRPFLQEFLHNIAQHFEVVVFTASQKVYADALLNILDPST
jgi:NLI interacting factor-like phosphatase